MKKQLLVILALLGTFGCVSKPVEVRTPSNSGDSECLSRFQTASQKMVSLIEKYPEVYGDFSSKESRQAMTLIPIKCVNENIGPTGVVGTKSEILVEQSFKHISHVFESAVGKSSMKRYKVNPRTAYFERVMVAYTAHAYSQALGFSEERYDTFFKTLAILQKDQDQ